MATRWFGAPVQRTEDPRLLRGKGNYVDDIDLPDMLHAAVLRSPHARARIVNIDSSAARELPGVHLVLTAVDLGTLNQPTPLLIPHPELAYPRTPLPLAVEDVRYSGELIAVVVADDRYLAEDAARLIVVDYETLPAVVDLEAAGAESSPRVHADVPRNRAARVIRVLCRFKIK